MLLIIILLSLCACHVEMIFLNRIRVKMLNENNIIYLLHLKPLLVISDSCRLGISVTSVCLVLKTFEKCYPEGLLELDGMACLLAVFFFFSATQFGKMSLLQKLQKLGEARL